MKKLTKNMWYEYNEKPKKTKKEKTLQEWFDEYTEIKEVKEEVPITERFMDIKYL